MNHFMNNGIEYLRMKRKRSLLYYEEIDVNKINHTSKEDIFKRGEKLEDYMYEKDTNNYNASISKFDYHDYCKKNYVQIEEKYL